ncbi:MAG: hypothetical protein HYV09_29705 [Deltaproteobacteria bacterium]|nr:hypothetical protein [Deltaproteobacteria bacterium]
MNDEPVTRKSKPIPWGVVFAIASVVSLIALGYYYVYHRDLGTERTRLLRERAALAASIAEDVGTLRGKVEPWTVALAAPQWPGDHLDPDARALTWRERPTVYLRMRAADAASNDAVRTNAKLSSLDGLSACLLRSKGIGPWAYGEVMARADFLGADFIRDVKETKNDLRLRNLAYALEQYKLKDFPDARDGSKLSEYAVIVLDEDPAQVPSTSAAFGGDASVHQKILSTSHPVRLSLRRLADGKELLRLRRTPDAAVMQVAGDSTALAGGIEVRRIQALGCAMANEALDFAGANTGPAIAMSPPPLPAVAVPPPAPSAAPSASASASPSGSPPAPSASAPK